MNALTDSQRRSKRRMSERWREEGLCTRCGGERDAKAGSNGIVPVRCKQCLKTAENSELNNRRKAQASIAEMRRQLAPFMEKGEA